MSEIREQMSDVRDQRTDVRDQREIGNYQWLMINITD